MLPISQSQYPVLDLGGHAYFNRLASLEPTVFNPALQGILRCQVSFWTAAFFRLWVAGYILSKMRAPTPTRSLFGRPLVS